MRKYVITINYRKYVTTDTAKAWSFAMSFGETNLISLPHGGDAIPDVQLANYFQARF